MSSVDSLTAALQRPICSQRCIRPARSCLKWILEKTFVNLSASFCRKLSLTACSILRKIFLVMGLLKRSLAFAFCFLHCSQKRSERDRKRFCSQKRKNFFVHDYGAPSWKSPSLCLHLSVEPLLKNLSERPRLTAMRCSWSLIGVFQQTTRLVSTSGRKGNLSINQFRSKYVHCRRSRNRLLRFPRYMRGRFTARATKDNYVGSVKIWDFLTQMWWSSCSSCRPDAIHNPSADREDFGFPCEISSLPTTTVKECLWPCSNLNTMKKASSIVWQRLMLSLRFAGLRVDWR